MFAVMRSVKIPLWSPSSQSLPTASALKCASCRQLFINEIPPEPHMQLTTHWFLQPRTDSTYLPCSQFIKPSPLFPGKSPPCVYTGNYVFNSVCHVWSKMKKLGICCAKKKRLHRKKIKQYSQSYKSWEVLFYSFNLWWNIYIYAPDRLQLHTLN